MFLKGLIIGFSIAAPVGPIGVLCIRRTLAQGRAIGLVSGLGAASADAFYGCIAGFGLTAISSFLVDQQDWFRLIGGAFLCYLGIRTLLAHPTEQSAEVSSKNGLPAAYASTLALTLTNPATILAFAAIFTSLGAADEGYGAALILVVGVFSGSALWWLILSGGVSLLRRSFTPRRLRWVNWISGAILLGFGLMAILSTLL
jgi:threonine/homoserine/homoserine lactone efflux protein